MSAALKYRRDCYAEGWFNAGASGPISPFPLARTPVAIVGTDIVFPRLLA